MGQAVQVEKSLPSTPCNIPEERRLISNAVKARNHGGQEVPRTAGTRKFNTAFQTARNLPTEPISPVHSPC